MKVIFITREGYNLSGARVRCYNFARVLREYGVSTEVVSFADTLGAKYGEKECEMSHARKITYTIKAFKILLGKEKDAVFFMQRLNYHSVAAFLASVLKGHKFIFDCDDWNIRENPVYYLGFYPSSKMEYVTGRIAKYSDACIVASKFLQEYLGRFNKHVYYIPTGVDANLFNHRNDSPRGSRVTFSWIGTAYHKEMYENITFLLDSFSLLADKYNHIFLDLAGEGKYFDEIKNSVRNFKYKDRVQVTGWISPDRIPDYLSNIDVGLLPLTQHTKFNRAKSPTKLFEYMAMAKPTVSSGIGEAKEIIRNGDNGFLANTKEEFAGKMETLLKDSSVRREMGRRARASIEKQYSLEVLGKQLYEIVRRL